MLPLTAGRAMHAWEFAPGLTLGLAVLGGLYLVGVWRLRARGDRWSVGRTVAFLAGLAIIGYAAMSWIGVYDDTLFWDHMVQHMLLQMVAPVFLALGAPITLALRTLHPRPRGFLVVALHSRVARVLSWPPVGAAAFALTPFLLYFTGWYQVTLTNDTMHQLQHVLFVLVGCMFTWPLLGIDPMPRRAPYPFRMLIAFLVLPAHAILGITIMAQTTLIAGDYYRSLGRTWGPSLASDQNIGGGILWSSGDFLGLLFFAVLLIQWIRAEEREAVRVDRHLDRLERVNAEEAGTTDPEGSLAAYNAMLARLAEQPDRLERWTP